MMKYDLYVEIPCSDYELHITKLGDNKKKFD